MKRLSTAVFLLVILCSCMKQRLIEPFQTNEMKIENDKYFKLQSFSFQQINQQLHVAFSTAWERDIAEMEVMRGSNSNQFCTINTLAPKKDSSLTHTYSITDQVAKGDTLYYLVKYTTTKGEWGYSTIYVFNN